MLKAYLAGPIEDKQDAGQVWRKQITPRLLQLGIEPIDPTKALGLEEIGERVQNLKALKASKKWEDFVKIMHKIWVMNKRCVDEADFLIVYCKDSDNLSGTIREMHEAYEYKKPIFLVVDGDPSKLKSHTLYMALKGGRVFRSFDELFSHLQAFIKTKAEDLKEHSPDLYQVSQKLLIVNDKDQLLILRASYRDIWDMAGGRLNVQEYDVDLRECLERELVEELGQEVKLEIFDRPFAAARDRLWDKRLKADHYRKVFLVFFEAKYLGGKIKLSDEHLEYKWVDIKTFNPAGLFKPSDEAVVQEFLRKKRQAHNCQQDINRHQ